jgi:hypothetical protein
VLTGDQVTSGTETIILAAPLESLTVDGGDGNDSITISAFTAPVASLTADGGGGDNQVTVVGSPPPGVTLDIVAAVQTVQIDVQPSSLNLASSGVISLVLYTTANFNAASVDVGSVLFAGAHAARSVWQDANGDGFLDLVLHFRTQETNLRALYGQLLADDINEDESLDSNHQQAQVSLTGQTVDDVFFAGFDQLDLFLSGKTLREMLAELAAAGAI